MDQFTAAAYDNVDRHLGDVCTSDDTLEHRRSEVWSLAFEGAVDAGANQVDAALIASNVADNYA